MTTYSPRARLARVRHDGDAGFTLVEALVSLAIFALVSAAATLAVITGTSAQSATSHRVAAAQVAQQDLERLRAMPRSALPTTSPSATVTRGNDRYRIQRVMSYGPAGATACPAPSATPTDTAPHLVRVTVRVLEPGTSRSVSIDAVLAC